MKLGLHTYTLHLWGLGQNWGIVAEPRPKEMNLLQLMDKAVEWGLDGLHITGCDLETKDDGRLEEVKSAAASHNLYLEYNCSRDEEFDPRLSDGVEAGIRIAEKLGADLTKLSLDIRRPRPLYGSCFHPLVMKQLCAVYDEVCSALPLLERTGMRLALENHTETFADEILWLIDKLNHPSSGPASTR
jgi:sugar phosphate isomerase/epimerase